MTGARDGWQDRFPGFDVVSQADQWDPVTAAWCWRASARSRTGRFFTPAEQAAAAALIDQLLGQQERAAGSRGRDGRCPAGRTADRRLAVRGHARGRPGVAGLAGPS